MSIKSLCFSGKPCKLRSWEVAAENTVEHGSSIFSILPFLAAAGEGVIHDSKKSNQADMEVEEEGVLEAVIFSQFDNIVGPKIVIQAPKELVLAEYLLYIYCCIAD